MLVPTYRAKNELPVHSPEALWEGIASSQNISFLSDIRVDNQNQFLLLVVGATQFSLNYKLLWVS